MPTRWLPIAMLAAACSGGESPGATVTLDGAVLAQLGRATPRYDAQERRVSIAWDLENDAFFPPFFELSEVPIAEGTSVVAGCNVAYDLDGLAGSWRDVVRYRPHHESDCTGTSVVSVDRINRTASVTIELDLPVGDARNCPSYCDPGFVTTDMGSVYAPPAPCDAGSCLAKIGCPGATPVPATCMDGQCWTDAPVTWCDNPGIKPAIIHVHGAASGGAELVGM